MYTVKYHPHYTLEQEQNNNGDNETIVSAKVTGERCSKSSMQFGQSHGCDVTIMISECPVFAGLFGLFGEIFVCKSSFPLYGMI